MALIFEFRDAFLYCHHSIDETPDPDAFSMHAHEQMEILCFLSGNASYWVEGVEYSLQPFDLMIMRSAEAHKLVIQPDSPYERIAIHFAGTLFDTIDPQHHLLRPFLDRRLGQGNLYAAAQYPQAYWHKAFSCFDFSNSAQVRTHLLSRVLSTLSDLCDAFDQRTPLQQVRAQGLAAQVVVYVNAHLFEDLTVQSIAQTFFRSPSQISRIFQQATGASIWKYVVIKRLLAARALLQRGQPAAEAGFSCGFKDYTAFFRAYKRHFGCAPSQDLPHA